ncbi:MAG: DUF4398 domain-containing protein [Oligoflexia bacterium]|nr:DUF4398 domain-containing protein [Oligoflexia bacterium]
MKLIYITFAFLCLTSCAGKPPFLEYSIAQTALQAARKVNAEQNTGSYWEKAISYYQRGKKKFQERDYISAERFFNESIKWAEKAENLSRFKMSTGEGI